jgi:catechol 2,3-dioxygenase-like lactoylglutathione lyase family enzyme
MAVKRFTHVAIRVADLNRSVCFYRDILGFAECNRHVGAGGPSALMIGNAEAKLAAVFLQRDGTVVELQTLEGDDPAVVTGIQRGLSHIGFTVTDLAGILREVEAAGGHVLEASRYFDASLGSEVVFVTDPDGTRIELIAAREGFDIWRGSAGQGR